MWRALERACTVLCSVSSSSACGAMSSVLPTLFLVTRALPRCFVAAGHVGDLVTTHVACSGTCLYCALLRIVLFCVWGHVQRASHVVPGHPCAPALFCCCWTCG